MIKCVVAEGGQLPLRQYSDDAGADLYSPDAFTLGSFESLEIDLFCKFQIPENHVGLVCPRSSISRRCVHVYQGVIDAGYRGSVKVRLHNFNKGTQHFNAGDRIAQLLVIPIYSGNFVQVDSLTETKRGAGGFGSTGK